MKVKISNLGAQERTVVVTERVPVSEIEKLRIEVDAGATSERQKPDSNGFIRWRLELPAFGRKTIELRYVVRKHGDVVGI